MKTSIVEKNSLLSQSIAHFHKVHVQSQRLQDGLQGFGLVNPSTDASSVTPSVRIQQEQAQVSRSKILQIAVFNFPYPFFLFQLTLMVLLNSDLLPKLPFHHQKSLFCNRQMALQFFLWGHLLRPLQQYLVLEAQQA